MAHCWYQNVGNYFPIVFILNQMFLKKFVG